jgi:hypothetical protein
MLGYEKYEHHLLEGHPQVASSKSLINNMSQGCGNQAGVNQY